MNNIRNSQFWNRYADNNESFAREREEREWQAIRTDLLSKIRYWDITTRDTVNFEDRMAKYSISMRVGASSVNMSAMYCCLEWEYHKFLLEKHERTKPLWMKTPPKKGLKYE